MPMAANARSWRSGKPQKKNIPVVKTAIPQLNEKRGFMCFIALEQMMMPLFASLNLFVAKLNPSCTAFSSIQSQAWQRKTPFGTKTDHLVSTSWATHDENYLCWSRALLDINQPLRQGVCDYFAVSNANVPAATSCSFQGKAASKVSHTTSQGHL